MQALAELAQAAQVALAQVGLAALGFVVVVPKLLPVFCLAPCRLWPGFGPLTCSLSGFGSVGPGRLADWTVQKLSHPQASRHTRFSSVRSLGGAAVVCWSVCPDQSWFDQSRLDQSRSDH